jgi:hypothetical protein
MKSWTLIGAVLAIAVLAWGKALPASATTPADPCQSSGVVKHSVAVSMASTVAGSTELIPASSQSIHVCGFLLEGGNESFAFVYGRGVDCSVSPVPLTGMLSYAIPLHVYSGPGSIFSVPANDALCVNETILGINTHLSGIVTYTRP